MYADNNGDRFPLGDAGFYPGGMQWWFALQPYITQLQPSMARAGVFVCPASRNTSGSADYGINAFLGSGWAVPYSYRMVVRSSETVLAGDRIGYNWHLNVPALDAWGYPADGYPAYRHPNRANVVLVDGHVEAMNASQLDQLSSFAYWF